MEAGGPADDAPAEVPLPGPICVQCGAPARPTARFCSSCGAPIAADATPPVAPSRPGPRVPGARWDALRSALQLWVLLLVCCGGTAVLARIMDSSSPAYDLGGSIAMAVVTVGFTWLLRDQLGSLLAPRRFDRPALIAVAVLWVALVAFIELYIWGLGHLGLEALTYLEGFREAGWPLWSAFALGAVYPAVFEELAFRGILYRKLTEVGTEREALVIQAALFSLLHLLPMSFVSHFLIGLALGWLRVRTRSLLPGMLLHFLYNATLLALELV